MSHNFFTFWVTLKFLVILCNPLFAKTVILLRHFQVEIVSRDDGICCQSNATRITAARNEYQR